MGTLDGKVVFITGAARGQGRSHAVTAAREGADVVLFDIAAPVPGIKYPLATEDDLDKTRKLVEERGRRALTVVGDVRSQDDLDSAVAQAVDTLDGIDGVVANAGVWDLGPAGWQTGEQEFQVVVDTVLGGVFRTIKAVAPHFVERRAGAIVAIASVGGLEATAGYTSYIAAKHGVIGLLKNTALELGPHNVRANTVCPGAIDTKIWDNSMGHKLFVAPGEPVDRKIALDAIYGYAPLAGRTALPSQAVSNAVVFLLSDLAEQITGVALPVDAGHLLLPGANFATITSGPEAERHRPPAVSPDDL
ncbi:mycofactocin-coupled SDR family oxidoreductase [Nocardia sp. NPDC051929]|uniref:mycofactocin-coupled SDR family oxidoreductase n=1 Tax=Nocardia sp. NPDC051929 TaxID=3364327 RepID=UPI0037CC0F1C